MHLALKNICFERNDQVILNQINCEVHASELLQVRGANGSGKSTLLKIIAGLIEPSHGEIYHGEKEHHYIGHQYGIKPLLTVFENMQLFSALTATKISTVQIQKCLSYFELDAIQDKIAFYLSAGQLRRLCLAKLLLIPRQLWILDEPTTALDADGKNFFLSLLEKHLEKKGLAIIATHDDLKINYPIKDLLLNSKQ